MERTHTQMYAPERQQEILRLAREGGRVDVLSLAEEFQVTAETVRRDLKALDRAGLVRRVHGGAIPSRGWTSSPTSPSGTPSPPTRSSASHGPRSPSSPAAKAAPAAPGA